MTKTPIERAGPHLQALEEYIRDARQTLETAGFEVASPAELATRKLTWAVQALMATRRELARND